MEVGFWYCPRNFIELTNIEYYLPNDAEENDRLGTSTHSGVLEGT